MEMIEFFEKMFEYILKESNQWDRRSLYYKTYDIIIQRNAGCKGMEKLIRWH